MNASATATGLPLAMLLTLLLAGGLCADPSSSMAGALSRPAWQPALVQRFEYSGFIYDDWEHVAAADEASAGLRSVEPPLHYRFRVRLPEDLTGPIRSSSPARQDARTTGRADPGRRSLATGPAGVIDLQSLEDRRFPLRVVLHPIGGDYAVHDRRLEGWIVLYLDDNTPGLPAGGHSGWFGYHDAMPDAPGPASRVEPYTLRRVLRTVDWVMQTYPVDPDGVSLYGSSMGGGGVLMLALLYPERFATAHAISPPVDARLSPFSLAVAQQLWGPVNMDLPVGVLPEDCMERFAGSTGPARRMAEDQRVGRLSIWRLQAMAALVACFDPSRPWLCVQTGTADDRISIAQFLCGVDGLPSFLDAWKQGRNYGVFQMDERGHGPETRPRDWSGAVGWLRRPMHRRQVRATPADGFVRILGHTDGWTERPLADWTAQGPLPRRMLVYSSDFSPKPMESPSSVRGPLIAVLAGLVVLLAGAVALAIRSQRGR